MAFVQALPADLSAAVLVVLHVAAAGPSLLPSILSRAAALPATHAEDEEAARAGRIYVAPPDHHLLLEGDTLRVVRTPKENGVRPSVDALFRSVARHRGERSVGIVLSGTLDDGTAGLAAIGSAGGRTVVQDPEEAVFPGMPTSAVRHANPQFVVPLAEIGPLVTKLVTELPPPTGDAVDPDDGDVGVHPHRDPASPFTCPDCGGTLFEGEAQGLVRFRCRVGHAYSADSLAVEQQRHLESALYAAVVALQERADLCRRMARRMEQSGRPHVAQRYLDQAASVDEQAKVVHDAAHVLAPASGRQRS